MPVKKPAEKAAPLVVEAPKSTPPKTEKALYYRIRKIDGYLAEILEVQIDEAAIVPKVVSKQDSWHLLLNRITQLVYPSADELARRKRDALKSTA